MRGGLLLGMGEGEPKARWKHIVGEPKIHDCVDMRLMMCSLEHILHLNQLSNTISEPNKARISNP